MCSTVPECRFNILLHFENYSSESESDIGCRSSVSDQESLGGVLEKRSKKINKGRWMKEEVDF